MVLKYLVPRMFVAALADASSAAEKTTETRLLGTIAAS